MRPLLLAMTLAFALPLLVVAQETTGGVRGRLRSDAGGPVATALVTASSSNLLGERRVLSAADGVFQFGLLPPGTYTLRVTMIAHRPLVIRDVAVRLGRFTGLGDLVLETAAIELGEVTVTAPPMTLDPVRTTVGATLTAEDYALLPVERDYKSAIAILPHVNTSVHGDPVNVGGSTGLENTYFIDGMNVTSPLSGAAATTLPYNFVRTVEVKAGGYEAQYGKALGAVVNAVTYAGTNDFEAQVFGFLTNDALTANPKSVPTLPEVGAASYDIGTRVSGPVARDRVWFSAAYNPRVDRVDREIPGFGEYRDETVSHIFAGKLTWRASARTTLELSLFGDPTTRRAVEGIAGLAAANPDPFLRRMETGGVTGSLRATTTLGTQWLLEAGLAYSRGVDKMLAETAVGQADTLYRDFVEGTASGGVGRWRDASLGRVTGIVRATRSGGRHTFVGGLEYEDMRVSQTQSFSGGVLVDRRESSRWDTYQDSSTGGFHSRIPTVYVQDAWRLTDRLTLSAGLRWSAQRLSGASGGTAQLFPDEWQPRLGFSWQLGRAATNRLFGSYGRFYQQIPLNMSTLFYADYVSIYWSYPSDPRQPGAVPDSGGDFTTYEEDWARSIDGLAVEHFDEATLGFESLITEAARLTVRVIRRDLRSSFQLGFDPDSSRLPEFWVIGTPGKGAFSFLPPPTREYTALELALDGSRGRLKYRASYVLSRTWGNYPGLYMSDFDVANPGADWSFMAPWQASGSTGPLPNDRPHVFKLTAVYQLIPTTSVGAFVVLSSGIAQNAFGPGAVALYRGFPVFLSPRGVAGRTPALWDVNLRLAHDLPWRRHGRGRAVLDLLHLGNPRRVTQVDEWMSLSLDPTGRPSPNPNYLGATAYQPPMAARIGIEINF